MRAARYGLPVVIAIIGGDPRRFRPFVDRYLQVLSEVGHDPQPIAIHSPGHVAATDELALEQLRPHWRAMRDRIGSERGWGPSRPGEFEQQAGPEGSLYVGSPETVARKIAATVGALGAARFDMKYSAGSLPHELMLESIRLYGTEVAPRVRELLADAAA